MKKYFLTGALLALLSMSENISAQAPLDHVNEIGVVHQSSNLYFGDITKSFSASVSVDDYWVTKIEANGSVTYSKEYRVNGQEFRPVSLLEIPEGVIVTDEKGVFIALDHSGNAIWAKKYSHFITGIPTGTYMCESHSGEVVIAGITMDGSQLIYVMLEVERITGNVLNVTQEIIPNVNGASVSKGVISLEKTTAGYFSIIQGLYGLGDYVASSDANMSLIKLSHFPTNGGDTVRFEIGIQSQHNNDLYLLATTSADKHRVIRMDLSHNIIITKEVTSSSHEVGTAGNGYITSSFVETPNLITYYSGGSWGSVQHYGQGAAFTYATTTREIGTFNSNQTVIQFDENIDFLYSRAFVKPDYDVRNSTLAKRHDDQLQWLIRADQPGGLDVWFDYRLAGDFLGCYLEEAPIELNPITHPAINTLSHSVGEGEITTYNVDLESVDFTLTNTVSCSHEEGRAMGLESSSAEPVQVYPNPSSSTVNIVFPDQSNYEVTITDLQGRTIEFESIKIQNGIQVFGLDAGVYLVHCKNEYSNFVNQFIIE